MAVVDVVKWNAPSEDIFAWKFPVEELGTWTQLIVSESQEVIMLKEGRFIGTFGPGKHTLNTKNFPFLISLLKVATGRSPFTAELWFIQKTFKLDVKWGTPTPIQLEDPQYHIMLPIRAYGQYGLHIDDAPKFLLKLIGTLSCFSAFDLARYFKGVVVAQCKDVVAKYLIQKEISILKIGAELLEISTAIERGITLQLSEFGVAVTHFCVNGISTDDNDPAIKKLRDALATKAEMDIIGYNYSQKRSFDTMEKAAANTGNGNLMNAGIGMAMGLGVGMPMGNMMGSMAQKLQPGATCRHCGLQNMPDAVFCAQCGKPLAVAEKSNRCPQCGKSIADGAKFCPQCGIAFVAHCKKCGAEFSENSKFCPSCGEKASNGK